MRRHESATVNGMAMTLKKPQRQGPKIVDSQADQGTRKRIARGPARL